MENKNFVPVLTGLRGIASLGVLAVHMHYAARLDLFKVASYILKMGMQGVSVFFVISGFVIPYSLWNSNYDATKFFKFILRRMLRIDPPYILVILIAIVTGLFEHSFVFNSTQFLFHFLYLIPFSKYDWYQGIFWTLGIEFQYYVLIGLLFSLLRNGNVLVTVFILVGLSFLGYFIEYEHFGKFILRYIHFFCMGIIVMLHKKQRLNILATHGILLIIALFLCWRVSIITGSVGYITSFIILHSRKRTRISDFFGQISYSLYLTHTLSATLILYFIGQYHLNPFLLFTILFLWCILLGTGFYHLIEKPSLKLSKKYG